MHHRLILDGPGQHMFWFGGLSRLLVVAMLVAGVILVVRMLVNRPTQGTRVTPGTPSGTPTPLQILEERFARGEIDEEEFRSRREALRS